MPKYQDGPKNSQGFFFVPWAVHQRSVREINEELRRKKTFQKKPEGERERRMKALLKARPHLKKSSE